MTLRVAYDMTPTLGTRTGIGNVVAHLYDALATESNIELASYTLSLKARNYKAELPADNIFVNLPARVLLGAWKYSSVFSLDKNFGNADMVHATNYLAPPTKKPLLITIHDVTMVKYPELVSPAIHALVPSLRRRLRDGAHVHVPVQAIKDDVHQYFGDDIADSSHIHVVPFACPDLLEAKSSAEISELVDGDPYILCMGALEPRKNHERLIDAFAEVHSTHPHVRLFLVGPDGPARPAIDAALARLSHEARSRIVITGPVSDADRTSLLLHSYMVAYPSLYEGFGLPALEAMRAGVPLVTTREGALNEVAGDAAVFVDANDVHDIARGITDILTSDSIRDKLIAAGKERVDEFSWDKSARMLSDVYRIVSQAH